jgi:large subunit ribosomal protein L29
MQRATQQLTKNSEIKKVRRDIAKIRTFLTQKATANE